MGLSSLQKYYNHKLPANHDLEMSGIFDTLLARHLQGDL